MRFATPEYLYAFIVIALLALFMWYVARRKKRLLETFADKSLLAGLIQNYSPSKRRYKIVFLFIALSFLALCLARPQFGTHMEMLKREGQDVMIVVDCSSSMLAEDMKPNRIERAKQEVRGLLSRMQGDRVGLVAFAGSAFVQCPLTLDYSAAQMFVDVLDVDLIPNPGTNLAEAISVATAGFVVKERKNKVMIIITDGEDFGDGLDGAISEAKIAGVNIYTIGIGRPEGEPIPIRNVRGEMVGYKKDQNGELIMTRLDEATLQKAAGETEGQYYHASQGEIALDMIYEEISKMEKKELADILMTQYEDRFQYILPVTIVFLIGEALLSERRRSKKENGTNAKA
ncbi:MAG: VWA domain-containing protein [Candidatus Zixiibacteriota bacterium]